MIKSHLRLLIMSSVSFLLLPSCEEEATNEETVTPTPVITSISPESGYPGEEVTITGENFNATASLNLVELDTNGVSLASITPSAGTATSLTFTRPNVSGVGVSITANLKVRNVEDTEEKVSDAVSIIMLPVFDIITVAGLDSLGVGTGNQLYGPKTKGGLAFDADGNLYARGQDPGEVYKITPDGTESYFGQTHWGEGEMHFGPDGYLYAAVVWGDYGIVRIPPSGGDYEEYMPANTDVDSPFDFQWDSDGNLYAFSNLCPHSGYALETGSIKDGLLTCAWHQARFDVADGTCPDGFTDDIDTFEVIRIEDEVWVNPEPR